MKTFIICEAGSCHEGYFSAAEDLCRLAKNVGANACKFQFCSNYERLMERRNLDDPPYKFSIEQRWIPLLKKKCDEIGIEFMCTVYIPEDIERIAPFVQRFKISAFELKDMEFVWKHTGYHKQILISGTTIETGLYCVSEYPCPDEKIKLFKMKTELFSGLSDHTRNPLTGALAVALGARYIETHMRLDVTSQNCPDYQVARSPDELKAYVKNIRQAEVLMYGS